VRWLAFVLALVPMQANALSCLRPTVERAFEWANEIPEQVIIVTGRVIFNSRDWPKRDKSMNAKPDVPVPARVDGKALSRKGFTTPFRRKITLMSVCYGPWCGFTQSGQDQLLFLKKTEAGYVQDVDPCGSSMLANPTQDQLNTVVACMNGAPCTPKEP